MASSKFHLVYDPEFPQCFPSIEKKYWNLIKEKIEEQLQYQPNIQTMNRKPLLNPPKDELWEIRFGPDNLFRVFYKISKDKKEVLVLSVGYKIKGKLYIRNEEVDL